MAAAVVLVSRFAYTAVRFPSRLNPARPGPCARPPSASVPSTSVAAAGIVPSEPSVSTITSSSSPMGSLNYRAATSRPDNACVARQREPGAAAPRDDVATLSPSYEGAAEPTSPCASATSASSPWPQPRSARPVGSCPTDTRRPQLEQTAPQAQIKSTNGTRAKG
jgi:hypothetical protein